MTKKKPISIASRKQKARILQNWVAEQISKLVNKPWGKDTDIRPREMGQSGTDVSMSSEVLKSFPFSVEAKACESWSVHKDIEQAKSNLISNTDWLLVYKRNRKDPVIVMDANAFFKLYQNYLNAMDLVEDLAKDTQNVE